MKTRAFAIIHHEEKFLLIRESNLKFKNQWYFPGGALEENEDISTGLMREVKEESGYDIAINGVCYIQYLQKPIVQKGLYLYCSARTLGGALKITADEHSIEASWFNSNEILELTTRGNLLTLLQMYSDQLPMLPTEHIQLNIQH